jgi:hypothetical protein
MLLQLLKLGGAQRDQLATPVLLAGMKAVSNRERLCQLLAR